MIALPVVIFVLGLFIGSFLNVVILRMNTGRSVVTGRSACTRCARTLQWYELFPVFSFLGLGGKCRTCKVPISFQYPIVELIVGIVFTILYTKVLLPGGFTMLSVTSFVFDCVVASILMVIFVYDLKHKIIPDTAVYSFIILALIAIAWKAVLIPGFFLASAIVGGVAVALPFFLLWALSKGRLMGFGDVKLALGIGWLLGTGSGFAALLLSFWIGGVAGLVLIALSKKYKMTSEIPFAPFLIIGTFIAGLWAVSISGLLGIWM